MTRTVLATLLTLASPAMLSAGPPSFTADVQPLIAAHCVRCHGPEKQEGKVRLDRLSGDLSRESAAWKAVADQLASGDMPPADQKQPTADAVARVLAWVAPVHGQDAEFAQRGNRLDHAILFGKPADAKPAGESRIWRLSPFAYRKLVDGLTNGQVGDDGRPAIPEPFDLSRDPGFRDYAFRYPVSSSELEQMALNARAAVGFMVQKRGRVMPPAELSAIANASDAPTEAQVNAAVAHMFRRTISREPTADELARYGRFLSRSVEKLGNRDGVVRGLAPVLLHPEAVFRSELGGSADTGERAMLSPSELALAISYGLTDGRPDDILTRAVKDGKLSSREDAQREVSRLLEDPKTAKPRILRFFQEYFGYATAGDVFKDEHIIKAAGIHRHRPDALVEDTDLLVLHVLKSDRDVLRQLLTTNESFVDHKSLEGWLRFKQRRADEAAKTGKPAPTHPFDSKKNNLNVQYNLPGEQWSETMPLMLPKNQRAGILTQPAWLVAFSTNSDNHAIHRGKWVRERLLGGHIPDTPITVEAKLPDEPDQALRHRMRVTREAYCWKCHERMDPLGLPFQVFDHFGRHRATELDQPVDSTGAIVASGDAKLDGKVGDALEMIRRLAESERVRQVFVRHAFRYWMGRNETARDAATLQAADQAYVDSGGSMKALIAALLTSDSFLYRARPQQVKP